MLTWIRAQLRKIMGSTTTSPASWFVEWIRGVESESGVSVQGTNALRYAPVWYAVNKICGHVGQLPLVLYEVTDTTRRKAIRHPAYRLMRRRPNEISNAHVFREVLTEHALLYGNGRAVIMRNMRRDPIELIPLLPDQTVTVMVRETDKPQGKKYHVWTDPDTHERIKIPDADVLHIYGLGYDGIVGYSLIEYAKNSLGLGLAAERTTNRLFRNNAVPSLVLEAPPGTFRKEEDAKEFLSKWNEYHAGADKAGRVGLLREGIKATPLSQTGRDSQWIEQRKFQRQEAALWFLLESILGDDSSVSYNSLEQKNLAYLTNCLMRWLDKWEQECEEKLLSTQQKAMDSHQWKFNTAALLRGTTSERYAVYRTAREIGVLSPNEIRQLEDLNPRPGGDTYENPNTSSSSAAQQEPDEPDEDDSTPPNGEAQRARLQSVILAQLKDLVRLESRLVRDAAAKQANFVQWLDDFYRRFPHRVANILERCGGTWDDAEAYCDESKSRLLQVSDLVTQGDLPNAVHAETAGWIDRAVTWSERITQGEQEWLNYTSTRRLARAGGD